MVKIVFIGNKDNKRINILKGIPESKLFIIKDLNKLPNVVIDLIIVEKKSEPVHCIVCDLCLTIKSDKKLSHIPIISLINSVNMVQKNESGCDLMVSELVSDIEFDNYVKTMIKMKLMDDELKKEKIVLELKVKERTLEYENKAHNLNITLNSIGDGVIVTDENGLITLINPAVKNLCKLHDKNDYLNKQLKDVFKFVVEGNELDIFYIVKKYRKKFKLPINSILITKNTVLRISDSASPIIDADDKFNGVVIVFNDVTDDYILKKNILESETKYKRLYDNVPDIIYTHTLEGVLTNINKNIMNLGYLPEDVLGKNIKMFLNDKNLEIVKEKIETKIKNTDLVTIYNIELITKDNEIRIYEIKSNIIKTDDNIGLEVFAIARDITDFIKFQGELEKAKEIAENSNNMKTTFISNMTHEIKTPLNSILGFSSLISEQPISEKIKSYIEIIMSSGRQLSDIIDNIIDISDISAGSLKLFKKEFKINDLLNEMYPFFNKELELRNKTNVNIILDLKDDLVIYSDYRRIKQIIYELVMNSIKFTNGGYIKYGYIVIGNHIEFFVHDTGIGIEEENLDIIFQSFYQINRQKSKKQEGTGLGLSLSKRLTDLFEGVIILDSKFGEGTSVYVNLPLEKMVNVVEPKKVNIYKGKKALVVVKDNTTYGILELVLLSFSLTVIRIYDYIDVITSLENYNKYDLIIIDVDNLPYNGYDLINWMTINKIDIPYIISSKNEELGINWKIDNPVNAPQLITIIKKIFE